MNIDLSKINTIRLAYPLFHKDIGSVPSSPLQFNIGEINIKLACELNKIWHSRLPRIDWTNVVRNTHHVCYAAEYKGVYFAVAIWSSPVAQNRLKDGDKILELRRFAISPEAPRNTASRMMKVMIRLIRKKFPGLTKLISYQDTEVHKGTIYKASNWTAVHKSKGISWTTNKRKRNKEQTLAAKVRWEYDLKI